MVLSVPLYMKSVSVGSVNRAGRAADLRMRGIFLNFAR